MSVAKELISIQSRKFYNTINGETFLVYIRNAKEECLSVKEIKKKIRRNWCFVSRRIKIIEIKRIRSCERFWRNGKKKNWFGERIERRRNQINRITDRFQ